MRGEVTGEIADHDDTSGPNGYVHTPSNNSPPVLNQYREAG